MHMHATSRRWWCSHNVHPLTVNLYISLHTKHPHKKQVALATSEELHIPQVAWPTLLVFVGGWILLLSPLLLQIKTSGAVLPTSWGSFWSVPVQAYAIYLLFTPLHDAVHRYVSVCVYVCVCVCVWIVFMCVCRKTWMK